MNTHHLPLTRTHRPHTVALSTFALSVLTAFVGGLFAGAISFGLALLKIHTP